MLSRPKKLLTDGTMPVEAAKACHPSIVDPATPRWLHWLAVLTVIAALPLLTLGAEVTTKKIGMVDRAPVRPIWHLLEEARGQGGLVNLVREKGLGWVIEHSHRTAGWLVGLLAIGLAVGLGLWGRSSWLRWAGLAALLGVASQGVLGILRVDLDQRLSPSAGATVAMIHGCTAHLVFALLVSVALWTSGFWQRLGQIETADLAAIRTWSLFFLGILYLQIVFGAMLRHKELAFGLRVHLLLAFVTVVAAVWLGVRVLRTQTAGTALTRAVWILWALLAAQLVLGMETLLSKFTLIWPTGERIEPAVYLSALIPSLHFLVGALTFSSAVVIALLAHRHVAWAAEPAAEARRQLEGAL